MLGSDYAAPIRICHAEHLGLCLCITVVEECLIETNDHTLLEREKMFFEDMEIMTQEHLVSSKKERKKERKKKRRKEGKKEGKKGSKTVHAHFWGVSVQIT
jgi:hypothetical protein